MAKNHYFSNLKKITLPTSDILPLMVIGITCGGIAGIATLSFLWLVFTIEQSAFVFVGGMLGGEGIAWRVWIIAITGALIVGQLNRVFARTSIMTADEIILAIQTRRGSTPIFSGLLTALAAVISLASGASLGQYGPVMSLGATLGSVVSRLKLAVPHLAAITMASGVSAAITVAFHAPITAVILVHEVVLRHFSIQAFAPVALAAAVGEFILTLSGERYPLFLLTEEVQPDSGNYLLFICMGVFGAMLAGILMKLATNLRLRVDQWRIPVWLQPVFAAVLLALIATQLPQSYGSGTQYFSAYLSGFSPDLSILIVLLAVKLILSSTCYAMRFVGGMVAPALFQGLLYGLIVGEVLDLFGVHIAPFYVGMVGMVSVASPVIGAPIGMIVMVFELTGNYWLATSAMLAVITANLTSYRWLGRSFYDLLLRNRGYDLTNDRAQLILQTRSISPFVKTDGIRAFKEESIATISERLGRRLESEAYITTVEGKLEGVVSLTTCISAQYGEEAIGGGEPVSAIMSRPDDIFYPDTTIWVAINKLRNTRAKEVVVVDRESNEFVGIVAVSDLLHAYMQLGDELNAESTGKAFGQPT